MSESPALAHFNLPARPVTVAAAQMACSWDRDANMATAERLARAAAAQGAQIILLPELFETPYFVGDEEFEFAVQANFGRLAAPAARSRCGKASCNSV